MHSETKKRAEPFGPAPPLWEESQPLARLRFFIMRPIEKSKGFRNVGLFAEWDQETVSKGGGYFDLVGWTSGYMRHVQVANLSNRLVDMLLQELGDLATKAGVIEDESANVVFTTIFDNKIAPVGELVAEVHLLQLSNFSNDSFGVLLDPLGPNRGASCGHDYASSKGDL